MKAVFATLALIVSFAVQAQNIQFTVINDVYTDHCFFDVLSINPNTGVVTTHCKQEQGFYGTVSFNDLNASDGDILIVQRRTHPERQLVGEFSARINLNGNKKLEVIETTERFNVSESTDYVQSITRND